MNEATTDTAGQKGSAGRKWAIGCGIGCLVILILLGIVMGVGVWGVKKVVKRVEAWTAEYEEQGYEKVLGQAIDVNEDIHGRKVYVGQVVRLFGNSDDDVAIIAQMAEIHGKIAGNLSFKGQMLTLQPSAVVMGDIDAEAQMVQVNRAVVVGEIRGEHQLVDNGMRRHTD